MFLICYIKQHKLMHRLFMSSMIFIFTINQLEVLLRKFFFWILCVSQDRNWVKVLFLQKSLTANFTYEILGRAVDSNTFYCLFLHMLQSWAGAKWDTSSQFRVILENFNFFRIFKDKDSNSIMVAIISLLNTKIIYTINKRCEFT